MGNLCTTEQSVVPTAEQAKNISRRKNEETRLKKKAEETRKNNKQRNAIYSRLDKIVKKDLDRTFIYANQGKRRGKTLYSEFVYHRYYITRKTEFIQSYVKQYNRNHDVKLYFGRVDKDESSKHREYYDRKLYLKW